MTVFSLCVFLSCNDVYFEDSQRYKKDGNQRNQRLLENYYRKIRFPKENSYNSMKHQKKKDLLLLATKLILKIPDVTNAKQ